MKKILLALLFVCSSTFAQTGFESGNLTGWTTSGGDSTASQALTNYTAGGGRLGLLIHMVLGWVNYIHRAVFNLTVLQQV